MTARGLFLVALSVGGFGIFVAVLVDSIRYRWKAHRGTRACRKIGLSVDRRWIARRERER